MKAKRRSLAPHDSPGVLIEVCVSALTTEPELREIARALIALVKYHERQARAVEKFCALGDSLALPGWVPNGQSLEHDIPSERSTEWHPADST